MTIPMNITIPSAQLAQLEADFKREISDKSSEVDPGNEQDWFSITLGWGIAKGLSIDHAHEFAIYVRYHTELG